MEGGHILCLTLVCDVTLYECKQLAWSVKARFRFRFSDNTPPTPDEPLSIIIFDPGTYLVVLPTRVCTGHALV